MAKNSMMDLHRELDRRSRELLQVYRPSVYQEAVHRSKTSELLVRGGKRAGKSVSVSALFASRVLGVPITLSDGSTLDPSFEAARPDYPRVYWIIGWDTKHIGQTLYRLLFEPGQGGSYRIIRDEKTSLWRAFNRADPVDALRVKESQLCEPLIPERFLEGGKENAFSWEDKKSNHFSSVKLTNGAIIYAFPSSSRNPKMGDAVSGIWIDEDIQFPGHVKEWQDRLTDEEGWLVWSAFPHLKNEALMDMAARAEMVADDPERTIDSVQLVMTKNPYLTDKGKAESIGRMGSEEEIARRDRGELMVDRLNMYAFEIILHGIQSPEMTAGRTFSPAHEKLRDIWVTQKTFPGTWTRYLAIDPSHVRTAVLSFVVPPPEFEGTPLGNVAIVEWEIVARRQTADQLAQQVKNKIGGRNYEMFIMDQMAGRQTHAGRDDSTMQHYANAFKKHNIRSRTTAYAFSPGCNIPSQRYRAIRDLMELDDETSIPHLLVVLDQCPETVREFGRYRRKMESMGETQDLVLDEPANPRLYDCMAALEYGGHHLDMLFAAGQAYVSPSVYAGMTPVMQHVKKLRAKMEDEQSRHIHLGAGSSQNYSPW